MFERRCQSIVEQRLHERPAVVLLGPRQMGKTTLAKALVDQFGGVYKDLETPRDLDQVADIELFANAHANQLVVLDEIQHAPALFAPLRGIIDRRREQGQRTAQFLLLGSASLSLIQQTSESLAGRIGYVELAGVDVLERAEILSDVLWLRGGFPDSVLARSDAQSARWREDLIKTYLERDIPQLGFRIPASTLRRFWTMLAHHHAQLLNAAQLAAALGVSGQSVARYLDVLVDLLLVRRLPPWHSNLGKRLVKSPKVYVRDSGLLHALLAIGAADALYSHPIAGFSWEGFVIENLANVIDDATQPYFFRTQVGAEIDLLLVQGGVPRIAIEIKRASAPKPTRGFHQACDDLNIAQRYLVYPGSERYALPNGVTVWPLQELMAHLRDAPGL
jgi:uncharacterized protein